ncbi:MAG: hypothetical protein P4L90_01155 [Rhodopila sp.]|nr:hypothetical protein [Rhodopila sp.]
MTLIHRIEVGIKRDFSPRELCDQCLELAEEADRAGFPIAAEHLFYLAFQVLEGPGTAGEPTSAMP